MTSAAASPPSPHGVFRPMLPGQVSRLIVSDLRSGGERVVLETDRLIEAPNWHPDGRRLVVNGWGRLFSVAIGDGRLEDIPVEGIDNVNNDHLLTPDGAAVLVSAGGGVFSVPIAGGRPSRLTEEDGRSYYLHGISPDGGSLACTTVRRTESGARWGIAVVPTGGGRAAVVIEGDRPVDGPEWSPDGEWLWFNGEIEAEIDGHSSLFRIANDGGTPERMTFGERVDWFPHFDPAGGRLVFLSYPPGTIGHPANVEVELRTMDGVGGEARTIARFLGGQGSTNVNGFAPGGGRFAYVSYPIDGARR